MQSYTISLKGFGSLQGLLEPMSPWKTKDDCWVPDPNMTEQFLPQQLLFLSAGRH